MNKQEYLGTGWEKVENVISFFHLSCWSYFCAWQGEHTWFLFQFCHCLLVSQRIFVNIADVPEVHWSPAYGVSYKDVMKQCFLRFCVDLPLCHQVQNVFKNRSYHYITFQAYFSAEVCALHSMLENKRKTQCYQGITFILVLCNV